jgi:hypothetical protein
MGVLLEGQDKENDRMEMPCSIPWCRAHQAGFLHERHSFVGRQHQVKMGERVGLGDEIARIMYIGGLNFKRTHFNSSVTTSVLGAEDIVDHTLNGGNYSD